jgi:hypothetical protein
VNGPALVIAHCASGRWDHGMLTLTLTAGGDGYCLHSTLQASPAARDLLPVLRRIEIADIDHSPAH